MKRFSIPFGKSQLLAAVFLSLIMSMAWATDRYVNTPGTPNYATIALAVAASSSGDTIWVGAGTYSAQGTISLNKTRLTLNGPNYNINPNTEPRAAEAICTGGTYFSIAATTVTVQGFTFTNQSASFSGGSAYMTIARNRIVDMTGTGMTITPYTGMLITENLIMNISGTSNSGMNIWGAGTQSNLTVSWNVIKNTNYAGIQTGGGKDWYILNNTIQNTPRQGMNLGDGNYVGNMWVLGNTVDNASFNNEEDRGGIRFYAASWERAPADGQVYVQYNTVMSSSNGIRIRACGNTSTPDSCQWDPTRFHIDHNNFLNNEHNGFSHPGGTVAYPVDPGDTVDLSNNYFSGNSNDAEGPVSGTGSPLLSPQQPDSDGDGLLDWQETQVYFTDPTKVDTDGDTYPDGLEVSEGTDPLNASSHPTTALPSATVDTDGDGYADLYEVEHGTDPNDPNSKPPLGDVNINGMIDNVDAVIIYNVSLGFLSMASYDFSKMDVNLDGTVNNLDAIIVFNLFLGNITFIPQI